MVIDFSTVGTGQFGAARCHMSFPRAHKAFDRYRHEVNRAGILTYTEVPYLRLEVFIVEMSQCQCFPMTGFRRQLRLDRRGIYCLICVSMFFHGVVFFRVAASSDVDRIVMMLIPDF